MGLVGLSPDCFSVRWSVQIPRRLLDTASGDPFERSSADVFHVKAPVVGLIESVTIEHNGRGLFSDWLLDYVEIFHPTFGSQFFDAGVWLDKKNNRKATLRPGKRKEESLERYRVTVHTGNVRGAGTAENVFTEKKNKLVFLMLNHQMIHTSHPASSSTAQGRTRT